MNREEIASTWQPARKDANDPALWVDEHGDVLYRYALARVRKPKSPRTSFRTRFSPRCAATIASPGNPPSAAGSAEF